MMLGPILPWGAIFFGHDSLLCALTNDTCRMTAPTTKATC